LVILCGLPQGEEHVDFLRKFLIPAACCREIHRLVIVILVWGAMKAIDKVVKLRKQTLDGNVETLLLAILEREPNYGYAVSKELNDFSHGILRLEESTIYVVLHRMQRRALISAKWSTAKNGRRRKYYRLTNKGYHTLETSRQQWRIFSVVMESVVGCV
jgi:PadR family transcriptional regulator PadR